MKITIRNEIEIPFVDESFDDFIYDSLTLLNPLYVENERMGRFNGRTPKYLYFFRPEDDKLYVPRGFLPAIISYCKRNSINLTVNDLTALLPETSYKFTGTLRTYQKEATKNMLGYSEGTLCSPTGSGKTTMGLYIVSKRKQPTIITIHTKELLNQWVDRIENFLSISKSRIGIIGDGKVAPKTITVALVQTLKKHSNLLKKFGHLVIDECHHIPAKNLYELVGKYNGRYITGLSATPYRRDGLGKLIEWYAGPIRHRIESGRMVSEGHICKIKPVIRNTDFISALYDPANDYSKLMSEISQDKDRNNLIIQDIIKEVDNGEICLVVSDRKNHCNSLQNLLSYNGFGSSVLTGETGSQERSEIVRKINTGKIKILIATGQLIGEGFDCKNLSCLFLTMPVKFSGKIIQYVGRVLRPKEGKEKATIYDYFDQNVGCLYGSFKNRQQVYESLK